MGEVKSIRLQQASKAGDCRLCNAVDILEELLADIKSGKILMPEIMYVALRERNPENDIEVGYHYRACGGTNIQLVGLLEIHKWKLAAPD